MGHPPAPPDRLTRPHVAFILRVISCAGTLGLASTAVAQDRQGDYVDKPVVVLNTGGHHATVQGLVFTADESRLLSVGSTRSCMSGISPSNHEHCGAQFAPPFGEATRARFARWRSRLETRAVNLYLRSPGLA